MGNFQIKCYRLLDEIVESTPLAQVKPVQLGNRQSKV